MEETLEVGGVARTSLLHLPPASQRKSGMPAVIALHPFTFNGGDMECMSGLSRLADAEGFMVAYPNGQQRVWNANPTSPSSVFGAPADDLSFIAALIARLVEAHEADPDRIYVVGASSGGLMAHRVACALPDKLAAAASVMITLPVAWPDSGFPQGPLPFLMIQGDADPFFPWQGGPVNEGPFRQTYYKSAPETVAYWVLRNSAIQIPVHTDLPNIRPEDGTSVYRESYYSSNGGAEVNLYGVRGGGHTWPGSPIPWYSFLVGRTCQDIDASRVIWDFFKTHRRNGR